jgi:hypothetical protein
MHKSHHDPPAYARGSHYEKRDVSLPVLTKWVFFLFIFIGFCSFLAWISYVWFLPQGRDRLALEPLTPGQPRPPAPVLQAYPKVEMRDFRVKENDTVTSYGWVKKETGQVRIPINEAIKLTAERGLPSGQTPVSKEDKELRPGNRPPGAGNPVESTPPSGSTNSPGTTHTPGAEGTTPPSSAPH